jgi:hypothetical protein
MNSACETTKGVKIDFSTLKININLGAAGQWWARRITALAFYQQKGRH